MSQVNGTNIALSNNVTLRTQLPAALVGGRLDVNVGAWRGSTVPTVGQKTMAQSIPVVLPSDQTITVTASGAAEGTPGSAVPASAVYAAGTDGTNLRPLKLVDTDTGGGTDYHLGVTLRKRASGGSVEAGTSSDPLRTDPTGTTAQPVTGPLTDAQLRATPPEVFNESIEMRIARTGLYLGKAAYLLKILGRRQLGWNSNSVLGDVAQYLDTSQDLINTPATGTTYYIVSTSASDTAAANRCDASFQIILIAN